MNRKENSMNPSINDTLSYLIEKTKNGNGDSDKHLMTFFSLVLGSGAKTIIELGVRNGDSTLPLTLAAYHNDGHVYSVDINESEFQLPVELKKHQTFFKSDAIKFLENWDKSKSIDLIYVDDWHSYEHVKRELEILDSLVSPNTVVILHDLMYGNTCPFYHSDLTESGGNQWLHGGPYRAVAELNPQFWEFSTLPYNNGLTILRKKYSNLYKQK
jgi:predicted O-methyltransferase YrrM